MPTPVVALDVGRSATKMSYRDAEGKVVNDMFPSIAVPAFAISDEIEAIRAQADTVTVSGREFFVGRTAMIQGFEHDNGLSDNWTYSPEHMALIKAGLAKSKAPANAVVVLGLPARLHRDQKDELRKLVQAETGMSVRVVPQPMGPYQSYILDENAQVVNGRSLRDSYASVDVGRYSSDMILMLDGHWIEQSSGSCGGVTVAVESLRRALAQDGIELGYAEAEEALRTNTIKDYGKQRDISAHVAPALQDLQNEVIETALRLIGKHARKIDGVIVAGGGAQFVAPGLKKRWPHTIEAGNSRFAVAEGFRRLYEKMLRVHEAKTLTLNHEAS